MRARFTRLAAAVLLLMAACHGPPTHAPAPAASPATAGLPEGAGNYRVDTAQSRIVVLAYRDGALAALGHNHVIVFAGVIGELRWHGDPSQAAFRLQVPLADVDIDDPARRAELGADFNSAVDDAARAGTRRNMLGERLLDASRYPQVLVDSLRIARQSGRFLVQTRVQVHGVTSEVRLPVTLTPASDGSLEIRGEISLKQSALGLTPFSVMMGALRVADTLRLSFELRAIPQGSAVSSSNAVPSGARNNACCSRDSERGRSA